jgi:hypothetical protein
MSVRYTLRTGCALPDGINPAQERFIRSDFVTGSIRARLSFQ